MSLCVDSAQADPRLILSAHVVEGLWLLQGGTVGGGGALNWFEREFAAAERAAAQEQGGSSFQQLDREAEAVPPGCQGLVFLPYLAGERSPLWDIHAKGVYYGIDFSKTRAHFARACMEGVAYSLRHNLEWPRRPGPPPGRCGPWAAPPNSRLWTQIKADITGKAIQVPASDAATLPGRGPFWPGWAWAPTGTSTRRWPPRCASPGSTPPNPEHRQAYEQGYRLYRQLYEDLKDTMRKEAL